MRSVLVAALLALALAGCRGDEPTDPAAAASPRTVAPAPMTQAAKAAVVPEPQHGLRARLATDPHSVLEFTGRTQPRGVVLCGVDVLGRGPGERYVWALCGDYRTGPDAEALSGSALAAVVRGDRIVFPRQQHLAEDIDRLFPPAVARAIRSHDVHPTPTADQQLAVARGGAGGARCRAGQLKAEQQSEGGPAMGTFYAPVVIDNEGSDCELLTGDLVAWAGRLPRARASIDLGDLGGRVLLPSGYGVRTFVTLPDNGCGDQAGHLVPLTLSVGAAAEPAVPVAGPGVPDGFIDCPGVRFTSAGRPAAPSR